MGQAKRIAQVIDALLLEQNFVEMIRAQKARKQQQSDW